ncbi:MAG: A/G-specific adenine glycosylase [Flavobacteriales bacterium]|nr:A/G-specific adenine glycosylase [Flavobacteriales bacterium]
MGFSRKIIDWYKIHARTLPWRETRDPYIIWVSEIILQQTRVDQGLPYFKRFIESFPDVFSLALADEQEVLKLWQGLGYYSRARNLHASSKIIVDQYNGTFPSTYDSIRSLIGIGDYTASAISSFCFDLPYAVLDGNVIRVISRYAGVLEPVDTAKGMNILKELSSSLLDKNKSAIYNQAMIEFGALQCVKSNPECNVCPIKYQCKSYGSELVKVLPYKQKKVNVNKRVFNFLVFNFNQTTYIHKRKKGIWKSLFQFPLIEGDLNIKDLNKSIFLKKVPKDNYSISEISETIIHKLSHQKIYAKFIEIDLKSSINIDFLININWNDIDQYPIPRLIDKYLKRNAMNR